MMNRKKNPFGKVETIRTRHPAKKAGFTIQQSRYDEVRIAILNALRGSEPLTHTELDARVAYLLGPNFKGKASWYTEVVKLDLEARRKVFRSEAKPAVYSLSRPVRL